MDKKKLRSIERPEKKESYYELIKDINPVYIADAERRDEILIINFFRVTKKIEICPEFRTFIIKDDYITQDLTTEKTKWKTGTISYLCNGWSGYPRCWWSTTNVVIASGENVIKNSIAEFTGKKVKNDLVLDIVAEYQENILKNRLKAKHKKETDVIDEQMSKFGKLPDDYQKFIEDELFADDNYIFYSRAKRKAYCSKCNNEIDIDEDGYLSDSNGIHNNGHKIKHNELAVCPYCKTEELAKSINMSRNPLTKIRWSVLVQKSNEDVLVRYFRHIKDFKSDYKKPAYNTKEEFRTVHTDNGSVDYEYGEYKRTGNRRWIYQREGGYGGYWSPSELVLPRSITIYNKDLDNTLAGTCMKYSSIGQYLINISNSNTYKFAWIIDRYLNFYRKNKWIEQIVKCGFVKLAHELMNEYRLKNVITGGKTICQTLDIKKVDFKILRKQKNVCYRDIEIMRYYRQIHNKDISEKDFTEIRTVCGQTERYKSYVKFMRFSTLYKLKKYLTKKTEDMMISDYFDYIKWLEELGYDMRNEFNLYPKDFMKAHDEISGEYIARQNKLQKEKVIKFNAMLRKMKKEITDDSPLNIKMNSLFIRLPHNLNELSKEGEQLHHCVGTYKDKVIKGETTIFFIRQQEIPDKSYYTLEWKNDHVEQCRGYRNSDMTPEVREFVNLFSKKMIQYIHKDDMKHKKTG